MTIFADQTAAVADMQAERLRLSSGSYFKVAELSATYIYAKLLAAEAEVSRRLRVRLEPTIVFAGEPTADEITAAGETPWLEEAAYDYEPDLWTPEDWGYLVLRNKPVSRIDLVEFIYPSPVAGVFRLPESWIRLDKKYGHVRFVPTGSALSVGAFGSMVLSMMSGGRNVPQMIRVRYRTGLTTVPPDLVDLIKKFATLKILEDAFIEQSGSISADGLSQSVSLDLDKYNEAFDKKLESFRQSIHGVVCAVL